jgi:hypothetical protein
MFAFVLLVSLLECLLDVSQDGYLSRAQVDAKQIREG